MNQFSVISAKPDFVDINEVETFMFSPNLICTGNIDSTVSPDFGSNSVTMNQVGTGGETLFTGTDPLNNFDRYIHCARISAGQLSSGLTPVYYRTRADRSIIKILKNIFSPTISYNRYNGKLRLSFWSNLRKNTFFPADNYSQIHDDNIYSVYSAYRNALSNAEIVRAQFYCEGMIHHVSVVGGYCYGPNVTLDGSAGWNEGTPPSSGTRNMTIPVFEEPNLIYCANDRDTGFAMDGMSPPVYIKIVAVDDGAKTLVGEIVNGYAASVIATYSGAPPGLETFAMAFPTGTNNTDWFVHTSPNSLISDVFMDNPSNPSALFKRIWRHDTGVSEMKIANMRKCT